MPNQGKSRQREVVILALLCTSNYKTAAARAGVSERTVLRWKTEPSFQREYEAAKQAVVEKATDRLAAGILHAVGVLEQLMDNGDVPAAARINACRIAIEFGLRTRSEKSDERKPMNAEFEARISRLEKAFNTPLILLRSDGTTRRLTSTEANLCQAMPQLTADAE